MTKDQREVQRKLRVLKHAEKIGCVSKTCRYFGIAQSSFYRLRAAYRERGPDGLKNAKNIPKNPANRTPPEIIEKVLHLRRNCHLGQIRIVWCLARCHGIRISVAEVADLLGADQATGPTHRRLREFATCRSNVCAGQVLDWCSQLGPLSGPLWPSEVPIRV